METRQVKQYNGRMSQPEFGVWNNDNPDLSDKRNDLSSWLHYNEGTQLYLSYGANILVIMHTISLEQNELMFLLRYNVFTQDNKTIWRSY